jgi:hypothetical protein
MKNTWKKKALRHNHKLHNERVVKGNKTIYAIRWLDNCIMDFLGWFQYDENKTDKELKNLAKERYGRNLVVITADEEWNFVGTQIEITHAERLWNTHYITPSSDDVWTIIN